MNTDEVRGLNSRLPGNNSVNLSSSATNRRLIKVVYRLSSWIFNHFSIHKYILNLQERKANITPLFYLKGCKEKFSDPCLELQLKQTRQPVMLCSNRPKYVVPKCRTVTFQRSYFITATCIWNVIDELKLDTDDLSSFKSKMFEYYRLSLLASYVTILDLTTLSVLNVILYVVSQRRYHVHTNYRYPYVLEACRCMSNQSYVYY